MVHIHHAGAVARRLRVISLANERDGRVSISGNSHRGPAGAARGPFGRAGTPPASSVKHWASIRHGAASTGASTSKGGGAGGVGVHSSSGRTKRRRRPGGQTWIGMCEGRSADVSVRYNVVKMHMSAFFIPRLAGRSVSQGVKGGRHRSSAWVLPSVCQ